MVTIIPEAPYNIDMSEDIRKQILEHCRILGIHALATPKEIKLARDRLFKIYHPDKNISDDPSVNTILTQRFKKIQDSYDFIRKNHALIQEEFKHLEKFALVARANKVSMAHWIYSEVESYKDDINENN